MKKTLLLLIVTLFLSGCASYKYQKSQNADGTIGYAVAREEKIIPEYTISKDDSLPDLKLAQQRFKRRKDMVEFYYKKMEYIQNRFHEGVKCYGTLVTGIATSLVRLPFVAVSDYRYEHDPQYRVKMQKIYDAQDAAEKERIAKLKTELTNYMQKDFALEEKTSTVTK